MMKFHPAVLKRCAVVSRGTCAVTLALSLSGLALAQQQEQPPPTQEQAQQPPQQQGQPPAQSVDRPPQNSQQQQTQDQQAPPPPAAQYSNRPPISRDQVPTNPQQYGQQYPPSPNRLPSAGDSNDQYASPPALLTIPAATVLIMRINEPLSSDHNQVGDRFAGVLDQPIVVNGWVVARRGQTVMGQVKSVQKAGRVKGVSQLGVELTDLTLVDGQQAPILTELWKASGGTSHGADAATIAGGTGLGAAIGAAADWGRGAAIGAGAGAVAGIGAVLLTRGRPTILEPESQSDVSPVWIQSRWTPRTASRPSTRYRKRILRAAEAAARRCGTPVTATMETTRAMRLLLCGYYYPCYYGPAYVGIYPGLWLGMKLRGGLLWPRMVRWTGISAVLSPTVWRQKGQEMRAFLNSGDASFSWQVVRVTRWSG